LTFETEFHKEIHRYHLCNCSPSNLEATLRCIVSSGALNFTHSLTWKPHQMLDAHWMICRQKNSLSVN